MTGVGFLGGGAILRTGLSVQGLTTAAGLWLIAAIGLAAGAGTDAISLAATVLGVVALTVLRRVERKEDDILRRRVRWCWTSRQPGWRNRGARTCSPCSNLRQASGGFESSPWGEKISGSALTQKAGDGMTSVTLSDV